ncbi:sugar ABC transporter permease [Ktedonosporobacter rubrisoli]|uniref:Sugar ABC transporter permease n=1 Tax=Ktedonosporobacter rubrisoli TaxID=2509675 RepID=A0A4P6K4U4_KTERU|nr:sugar ABC transporter permease [Ktedonosporobacter rubrisoli]QBD82943.1 sugar ABC transporter permease [Ktedonosporobacter rubrisoli]
MAHVEERELPRVEVPPGTQRVRTSLERRRQLAGILFVLPSMAFVIIFFLIPLVMMFYMSLTNWSLIGGANFIGLQNYRTLVSDAQFWQSLFFTAKYTAAVTPIIMFVAFGLALLVKQRVPGVGFFRTAYFLPVVVGLGTSSILWTQMFNDQTGVFDAILQGLKLTHEPIVWLADPTRAIFAIGVMVVWKTVGLSMIFFLVGMNAIPDDFYDAARTDGAGWWARLYYITLPLLRSTFALALVLSVIGSVLAFDQFYIMTQGGPQNQTITAVYWIYNTSFTYFKLGYGASLSLVLLGILVILSVIQLYLLRSETKY